LNYDLTDNYILNAARVTIVLSLLFIK